MRLNSPSIEEVFNEGDGSIERLDKEKEIEGKGVSSNNGDLNKGDCMIENESKEYPCTKNIS